MSWPTVNWMMPIQKIRRRCAHRIGSCARRLRKMNGASSATVKTVRQNEMPAGEMASCR